MNTFRSNCDDFADGSLAQDDAERFDLELDRAEQADPVFIDAGPAETPAQRRFREFNEYDADQAELAERERRHQDRGRLERNVMNCSVCGEELDPKQECTCPGSSYCTCEFEHHHFGCCESFDEVIDHFEHDHPELAKDQWSPVAHIPQNVLDAHDESMYRRVAK